MSIARALLLVVLLAGGCKRTTPGTRFEPVPGRPYEVRAGPKHDARRPAPVLFLLHAYGTTPQTQESYFRFGDALEKRGWLLVLPTGTTDRQGALFWNATEACCDLFGTGVDDLAYLDQVFEDLSHRFAIDSTQVFALGLSNGGFLAHRLACDRSERFRAVASVAGAGFEDPERCRPARPVGVLEVHGDADDVVSYQGGERILGSQRPRYPPARTALERWAKANGCTAEPEKVNALDFDRSVPGPEVTLQRWGGCASPVELWTVPGGTHPLPLAAGATEAILEFFARQTRGP